MKVVRQDWSREAEIKLAPVMGSDAEAIRRDVKNGVSELYCIEDDTLMVTRLEGSRLIICCLIGAGAKTIAPYVYLAAKEKNCTSIQFHTERKGLQRLLTEYDFEYTSQYYIYELRLK